VELVPPKFTKTPPNTAWLQTILPLLGEGRGEGGRLRFIDLFCGIGGFRIAFEKAGGQCVFSSDWNEMAQTTYEANFGERPHGDIYSVPDNAIPPHNILCALVFPISRSASRASPRN